MPSRRLALVQMLANAGDLLGAGVFIPRRIERNVFVQNAAQQPMGHRSDVGVAVAKRIDRGQAREGTSDEPFLHKAGGANFSAPLPIGHG